MESQVTPDFYAMQSPTTDPGLQASLYDDLPTDLEGISKVTQGLVYHYMADQHTYGWIPPSDRIPEINTRSIQNILNLLTSYDSRPLTEPREYPDRMVGCCRDFALLACSILRHQGVPARLRYGFAGYFVPEYWIDHVVVEAWIGGRWQRFDPEVAGLQEQTYDLFDMVDVPFAVGGEAWRMCRDGKDPDRFGLGPEETKVRGLWFVRQRLQLDVAALNKVELLCWDSIKGLDDGNPGDESILDEMAELSTRADSTELRERCEDDSRWRLPPTVDCFHPAVGPSQVAVS